MPSLPLAAFALVLLLDAAPALDYDSFCDAEGRIHAEHTEAAQAMVQRTELLEQLYVDATQGNPRAARVFHELAARYFPDIGSKNFVDLYRPNPAGGIDYVEVDELLKSGVPRADVRAKLKKELTQLDRNDTLLFVDKTDPSKRILYRFGDDPSVVDTRTSQPSPRSGLPRISTRP